MKISHNWLNNYLSNNLSVKEIDQKLTAGGLEVEGVEAFESIKGGLKGLFVGEVLTCTKHPNADKLSLTTVNVGGESPLSIVCGAPNVAAGLKVIVAIVGSHVHPLEGDSFEIKKSKIRGELSEGMICAEDEIGLGKSHDGILILSDDAIVGTRAEDYFKIENDSIFEIGLTPNRADAASHIGVARDLSALMNVEKAIAEKKKYIGHQLILPSVEKFEEGTNKIIDVTIEDPLACPRYSGITITNVKVGESPDWLKNRLKSIGVGPINNVVDITNFVLHECGQPLHAFDADKINGKKVIVRSAKDGEKFKTLDGIERIMKSGNLMICNSENPMCIAGIFGGADSGISDSTVTIFLESAYFDSASIRKTGKQHSLKTDASFRFERGTDPEITLYALKRASLMIEEICNGTIASPVIDIYPIKKTPVKFEINYSFIDQFSGEVIDRDVIATIIESLGMKIVSQNSDGLSLEIPAFKVDVLRPVDVIEEILRIYGYDRIPLPKKQSISLPAIVEFDRELIQNKIADYLAAQGFNEILTNSLTRSSYVENGSWSQEKSIQLLNPLSQDLSILRQDLLMNGLEILQYNRNRRQVDLKMFEFGKVYSKLGEKYSENYSLAIYATGKKQDVSWQNTTTNPDFFFLKSIALNILEICGVNISELAVNETVHSALSYGLTYTSGNKTVLEIGPIKPSVSKQFDLNEVIVADFNWDVVIKKSKKKAVRYSEISKFPAVKRDLSMLVDLQTSYSTIRDLAFKTEKKILREVNLFDLYQGDKMEKGKKSLALSFHLLDDQQTLTDKQIDKTMEKLMAAFESEVGAVIRKS